VQLPTRHAVRTPVAYWLVVAALGAVACVPTVFLVAWAPHDVGDHPWMVLACAGLLSLPLVHWFSTAAYRVPGGAGELQVHADRLELHDRRLPGPRVVLPFAGLDVALDRFGVRYTFGHVVTLGTLTRTVATFTSGDRRLVIASTAFSDPRGLAALLRDLDAVRAGGLPAGLGEDLPAIPAAPAAERDAYDDQLDRELEEMD
jgi:hypothetical protein